VPRYKYYCQDCDTNFLVFHSMEEKQEECVQCLGNNIAKSVTSPSYIEKKNVQQKIGALTNKHIEESKKALKEQIKEVRGEEYEPS
jgi:putative FmdB family regulatory protein